MKNGVLNCFRGLLAAGLWLAAASLAHAGGTLTVSSAQDPGSWDPVDTYLVAWATVATNLYDGLTYRNPDGRLVAGLATSWETLDGGKRIRFHLRKGVTFHDGEPFNAKAVKFTFERLLGKQGSKGPQKSNYAAIDHVAIIDDVTVDFYLKAIDPVLLTKLAGYGAMIVPPDYIRAHGEDWFNTHPVGTGPFKFVSYEPKIGIKLERFEDFWGAKANISRLDYRFIAEPATAVAELQAGRVDLVSTPPGVPISMIGTIKDDPQLEIVTTPGPSVYALRFNTANGITRDERVRKAIILGVDRQAIIDSILSGYAAPIASFQSALSFGYDPNLSPLPYDPARARKLLEQAGIKPGTKLRIDIRNNNASFNEAVQAVAGYLQMIGLKATIKLYESNYFLNDIVPQGKTGEMFQQAWGGWTFDYDNTAYFMYHTGEKWNPYDRDPKLDKMLEAQRMITDRDQRRSALRAIAKYVADHALELPLYNPEEIFGINRRVHNFIPVPDSRLRLNQVSVD